MAKTHLLVSLLTLIVALVHGQEAFPEQELQVKTEVVEFAEDFLEVEQNSYNDLLLLGSATSRADCIQKKKCRNKGGSCQKKGEACPGKIVKGCAKGCSCCLPENITCKRSKKCKKANGTCVNRGECNGEIIDKGCRKPKSCKKTHVCCVEDESTCRSGSDCVNTDLCDQRIPASNFSENHLCVNCITNQNAETKMNSLDLTTVGVPYLIINDRTFGANAPDISYTDVNSGSAEKCKIKNRVQIWSCKKKPESKDWTCSPQGFCTAEIDFVGDDYKPKNPTCTCPNPFFEQKHVCPHCENNSDALDFVNKGKPPTRGNVRDVFTGLLKYEETSQGKQKLCLVTNPTEILSWQCIPKANGKKFENCVDIGYCTNIRSRQTDGHFEYKDKICYRVHFGAMWEEDKCPTLEVIIKDPDTAAACMKKCKNKVGCNAFNYIFGSSGANCYLKKCSIPYSDPISKDGYDAYYEFEPI